MIFSSGQRRQREDGPQGEQRENQREHLDHGRDQDARQDVH